MKEPWLASTQWSLLHTVEEARLLRAEGVCLMYFMGAACELATLEIVADVCGQCLESEYPVMVEALPCPGPGVPDPLDAELLADACRIAFEHGADLLKTYYPGTQEGFAQVVAGTTGAGPDRRWPEAARRSSHAGDGGRQHRGGWGRRRLRSQHLAEPESGGHGQGVACRHP